MPTGQIAALVGPSTVEVKTFPLPEPAPGAALLAVRRANVCGTDVHQWHYESVALRNSGLGHEFVGEIVALGDGVTTDFAGEPVAVGDRVVPVYYLTCHRCPPCLRAEFNLCLNGLAEWIIPPDVAPHFRSGFATHYYLHPGQYFYKVPDEVDDATVAGANCGLAQMLFVLDQVGIEAGETLAVQGAGGLGLYAAAIAAERGARVVVIDGVAERLELARRFGATDTVDLSDHPEPKDRVAAVQDLTGGIGADMVLEVTGVPAAFVEAVELARVGGRIASVGNLNAAAEVIMIPGIVTRKSVQIHGVLRYHPWYLHKAVAFLARRQHQHPFDALSDRSYPLANITDALKAGESRSVARVAIVP
ncbi:zinc-binding dehydrogenase [Blastococcus sp. PRF04-17]|uniref:zinc-binding dehydrogenase n=1 Tax=Blastococcus sp. PRF04-17 TaxID=2933797 RepID=UPI001FF6E668|nr:zinc-binding dehydrogenase [Blastococcus sp. PRF04-17]UOY02616.1 zinc-binding dehydrogenase [Blastococcus sp. PRF04-17]